MPTIGFLPRQPQDVQVEGEFEKKLLAEVGCGSSGGPDRGL